MNRVNDEPDYDIIVVGGGPAGCAFVRTLIHCGANLRVLLIDKHRFPRDKICGDGLTYRAIPLVREIFPELAELTPSAAFTSHQILWYPRGRRLIREEQTLDVIPRTEFDNALWQATRAAGAQTLEEATITAVLKENGRVKGVTLLEGSTSRPLTCRLLVGADGSRSIVRRETGPTKNDNVIHALRQYVRGIPESTEGLIFRFDLEHRGYFWIFPFVRGGERWANIGYGNSTDNRILKERFAHYCNVPEMKTCLGTGVFEGPLTGFPLNLAGFKWNGRLSRRLWGDGYLLLGDAAALIHPLTGEGISFAIESGRTAAEVLVDDWISQKRKGAVYERRVLRQVRPSFLSQAEFCAIRLPCLLPRVLSEALAGAAVFAQKRLGLGIRPIKQRDVRGLRGTDLKADRAEQKQGLVRAENVWLLLLLGGLAGFWVLRAVKSSALPAPYGVRASVFTALGTIFCTLDARRKYNLRFALSFLAVAFVLSLGIEILGRVTGMVFGAYHYKNAMPLQLFGLVPLVVPFVWFIITYLTFETASAVLPKDPPLLAHLVTATALLVAWDMVADPNHVYRGGWVYSNGGAYYGVPFQNFAAWAVLGFLTFLIVTLVRPPSVRPRENDGYASLTLIAYTAIMLHEAFTAFFLAVHPLAGAIAIATTLFVLGALGHKHSKYASRSPLKLAEIRT